MGPVASGRHGDRHFPGNAELLDEARQRFAEVVEGLTFCNALTMGAKARAQLRMRAPNTVLVAFDDDWHGDRPEIRHEATISSSGRNPEAQ